MANIKIVVNGPLMDGHKLTFKAPCDCISVEKLKVCYVENATQKNRLFTMKDAHGNDLTGLGNLFSQGAYVDVVLDTVNGFAYLQNAGTNKYLEQKITPVDNLESDRSDLPLSARMGSELNKNLNVRYNPETDSVEIYYNEQWNTWKSGNLQTLEELLTTLDNVSIVASSTLSGYPVTNVLEDSIVWYSANSVGNANIVCTFPSAVLINNIYFAVPTHVPLIETNVTVYFSEDGVNFDGGTVCKFTATEAQGKFYFENVKCTKVKIQFNGKNTTDGNCNTLKTLNIFGRLL